MDSGRGVNKSDIDVYDEIPTEELDLLIN